MQVLTGPPGSGKTSHVLNQVRGALRQRNEIVLIVPTSTMGEHFRNQLAREGLVFRPSTIITLSKFAASLVPDFQLISSAMLALLVEQALADMPSQAFAAVRIYAGFRASVVDQIEELTSAGITSQALMRASNRSAALDEFIQLFAYIETEAAHRGWCFRGEQLATAAGRTRTKRSTPTILHGFFSLTRPELELVSALGESAELLITLPTWKGAEDTLRRLKGMGCQEIPSQPVPPLFDQPRLRRILTNAPTADQEAEEIARRILSEHKAGRPFRDIGIIVRSEAPCVPALRCALERFGIPARFYFGARLKDNSAIAYLSAIIEAMLTGWEHEATLAALRKSGSPMPLNASTDEFEFRVRNTLPNGGLAALRQIAGGRYERIFRQLDSIDAWRNSSAAAGEWMARFRQIGAFFVVPEITDGVEPEKIEVWRSQAAALGAFQTALDELGLVLKSDEDMGCREYWAKLKTIIEASTIRVPDHRRNVVHVIDAYEARQWKLPVIFLCGLLEKQFPKHYSESPLIPDRVRLALASQGVHLRTTANRQEEEQFLFELAATRATSTLVLSYPLMNAKGDATLPSFYLEKLRQSCELEEPARPCRPQPAHAIRHAPSPGIFDEALRAALKTTHLSFHPTAIETFLQCPFQFFARYTLRLQDVPLKPADRLNALLQGNIAHETLHRMYRDGEPLTTAFHAVWAVQCARNNVADGYRAEAVRLELFRNVETFVNNRRLPGSTASEFERKFSMKLPDGTEIRGRIDRIDADELGRSLVIDYKYKRKTALSELVKAHNNGTLVQGGLYIRALRAEGYKPAGMVYAGFRREASFRGWVSDGAFTGLEQSCSAESVNEVVRRAMESAVQTIADVHNGRIAPLPADERKCAYCAFADACRVEIAAARGITRGVGL